MTDINLQTLTPDTSLPTTGFLFGADSQASGSPSVFTVQSVATTLLGSTTLSGATITADAPVLNLAQTWNNAAITFTGLKLNATDTASAAGSLLQDLQVGGISRFRVPKDAAGPIVAYGYGSYTSLIPFATSGAWVGAFKTGTFQLRSDGAFAFGAGGDPRSDSADLLLARDAANTLAQRNGVNAQAFRLYNTYTDGSNYERLFFEYAAGDLAYRVGTQAAGTGVQRNLRLRGSQVGFEVGTALIASFGGTGHLTWTTDNTYDIGASGANRPRQVYVGTKVTTFQFETTGTIGLGKALTSTSYVSIAASTTALSSLNIAQGAAPTAPVDGDIWREDNTNTGLKIRVNGVTKTITLS